MYATVVADGGPSGKNYDVKWVRLSCAGIVSCFDWNGSSKESEVSYKRGVLGNVKIY